MSKKENIRNWILTEIQNKKWAPGEKIPSINQIAEQFSASRETVRLSLENLVQRGVLQPKQGMGYFVASQTGINLRVALLCKIDGVYIKPIYQGLIDETGKNISIQINEIRQSEKTLMSLLEDFITRQAIDCILVIPAPGKEEETDKLLRPFKRRIPIGWIDKAPADTKDPVFLCDYKACVKVVVDHFNDNDIEQVYYFSRNRQDQSVFTTMRKAFRKLVSNKSNATRIIFDWQHLLSIINENKNSEPIGIMAETDNEAAFLLSRLKSNGVKIPQQVSIICCDNSEITELVTPSITSVDPGYIEVGRKVRSWINGDVESNTPIKFYSTPILIKKESSI